MIDHRGEWEDLDRQIGYALLVRTTLGHFTAKAVPEIHPCCELT